MNKMPLIENACKELMEYGVRGRQEKCKNLVKRLLLHQTVPAEDLIFWPTGLLAAGLWHCRAELADSAELRTDTEAGQGITVLDLADGTDAAACVGKIDRALAAYYERWFQRGMPLAVLDDLLAGETLLDIYTKAQEGSVHEGPGLSGSQLKTALDRMAAYAAGHPTDGTGSFLYRPATGETTVFADGIGLACPFLYRYGELFDQPKWKELAVLQIANFFAYGMDGVTGLPYHGYDRKDGCKYGIIGWGRAVGWLLRGMAGCMISDHGSERLRESFTALVDAALVYQRQDGYFAWQLAAIEGPADTSATGMICAGIRRGIEMRVLAGATYENALAAGRCALESAVRDGLVYDCSGECEGFSCYPQRYGAYPWSLGPALTVL